jgi:hypothetical protein
VSPSDGVDSSLCLTSSTSSPTVDKPVGHAEELGMLLQTARHSPIYLPGASADAAVPGTIRVGILVNGA